MPINTTPILPSSFPIALKHTRSVNSTFDSLHPLSYLPWVPCNKHRKGCNDNASKLVALYFESIALRKLSRLHAFSDPYVARSEPYVNKLGLLRKSSPVNSTIWILVQDTHLLTLSKIHEGALGCKRLILLVQEI